MNIQMSLDFLRSVWPQHFSFYMADDFFDSESVSWELYDKLFSLFPGSSSSNSSGGKGANNVHDKVRSASPASRGEKTERTEGTAKEKAEKRKGGVRFSFVGEDSVRLGQGSIISLEKDPAISENQKQQRDLGTGGKARGSNPGLVASDSHPQGRTTDQMPQQISPLSIRRLEMRKERCSTCLWNPLRFSDCL